MAGVGIKRCPDFKHQKTGRGKEHLKKQGKRSRKRVSRKESGEPCPVGKRHQLEPGLNGCGFGTRKPLLNFKKTISVVCWRQKPDLSLKVSCTLAER